MWNSLAGELFHEYMGVGLVLVLFLAALVYLFLTEKRKHIRLLFLYVPVTVLLLFFNPPFAYVVQKFVGDEIYYRVLWLLPVTVVTAYAAVSVCGRYEGRRRALCIGVAALLMAVSGNCVYGNSLFTKADNLYHVPDSVVHICDAIEIEGREVTAAFPLELVVYVRQYSPVVCMPYGRELLVDNWNAWPAQSELCDEIEADEPDARRLGSLAREEKCIYIILSGDKKIQGDLKDEGYGFFAEIDGYVIYKDLYF